MVLTLSVLIALLAVYGGYTWYQIHCLDKDLDMLLEKVKTTNNGAALQYINDKFDILCKEVMLPNHFSKIDEIREVLKTKNRLNKIKDYN